MLYRNRIEIIPVREIRKLRGFVKGIDTSFVREGDRLQALRPGQRAGSFWFR